MCNYQFKHQLPHGLREHQSCSVSVLLEAWRKARGEQTDEDQAAFMDGQGRCVFHSEDREFVKRSKIKDRFLELLEAVRFHDEIEKDRASTLNLCEITVGEPLNQADGQEETLMVDALQVMETEIYFDHAVFSPALEWHNCQFSLISFANAVFHRPVSFMDGSFGFANFHRIHAHGHVSFELVSFNRFTDFSYSTFADGLEVLDANFHEEVVFAYSLFRKTSNSSLVKYQGKFTKFTDFTSCVFEVFLILNYCIFEGEVNFTDAVFRSRLFIKQSEIKANFFIKKERGEEPVFQDLVDFEVDPEAVSGKIIFENVSFLKINEQHKSVLLDMVKSNKVEIGAGCIKYRLKTMDKRLDLQGDKQSIIVEFTQSFVNYFLRSSGLNLGLEIRERTKEHLIYYLFSDENISEKMFHRMLLTEEGNFLRLLMPFETEIKNREPKKAGVLAKIDGFAALLSTCIRIGFRISVGEWSKRDTAQLLNAVSFQEYRQLPSEEFHQFIETRFGREQITNNYFVQERIGLKMDRPMFLGDHYQFADQVNNRYGEEE